MHHFEYSHNCFNFFLLSIVLAIKLILRCILSLSFFSFFRQKANYSMAHESFFLLIPFFYFLINTLLYGLQMLVAILISINSTFFIFEHLSVIFKTYLSFLLLKMELSDTFILQNLRHISPTYIEFRSLFGPKC